MFNFAALLKEMLMCLPPSERKPDRRVYSRRGAVVPVAHLAKRVCVDAKGKMYYVVVCTHVKKESPASARRRVDRVRGKYHKSAAERARADRKFGRVGGPEHG